MGRCPDLDSFEKVDRVKKLLLDEIAKELNKESPFWEKVPRKIYPEPED